MINLNEKNFEFNLKSGRWIIDVWQDNCGDCAQYAPIFRFAQKNGITADQTKFANFKVQRQGPSEFRRKYLNFSKDEIAASPTTLIIEDGKMVKRVCGIIDLFSLKSLIEKGEMADLSKFSKGDLKIMAFDAMESVSEHGALQQDAQIFYAKLQEAINAPALEEGVVAAPMPADAAKA